MREVECMGDVNYYRPFPATSVVSVENVNDIQLNVALVYLVFRMFYMLFKILSSVNRTNHIVSKHFLWLFLPLLVKISLIVK